MTTGNTPHSEMSPGQRETLRQLCDSAPTGPIAELGVYKGGTASELYKVAESKQQTLHLFDTFTGIPERTDGVDLHNIGNFKDTSIEEVKTLLPNAVFHVGFFPDTLTDAVKDLAFVHIDCDQYQTCKIAIERFWGLLVPGGLMVIDDWYFQGIRRALYESKPLKPQFTNDGLLYFVKS